MKSVFILTETVYSSSYKWERKTGEGVECSSLTATELEQLRLTELFKTRIGINLKIRDKFGPANFHEFQQFTLNMSVNKISLNY